MYLLKSDVYMCLRLGGDAVFKVRDILAMFSDTLFVDDELLCAQQGLQYRKGQQQAKVTKAPGVRLYPNPTNNNLAIQIEQEISEPFTIIITNTLGQIIWQGQTHIATTLLTNEINTLASGTYLVQVYNNSRSINHIEKFIKM